MTMTLRLAMTLALLASVGSALAYTRPRWQIGPDIKQSHWPAGPISIQVNIDPPNTITAGSNPLQAVRNMFERRSLYTPLEFAVTQTSSPDSIGLDGVSLVTFKNTPANQSAVSGFAAVTWFWWSLSGGEPVLTESDIVFTNTFTHSSTGAGGIDIEGLGGHEVIHLLSFDHSAVIAATAFPSFFTQNQNERNYALDDLAGLSFLYPFPWTAASTGSLTGTVVKAGSPVFGAHVVAQSVPDGAPVSDISVTDGAWSIDGLPPGPYRVYVEPLDGPSQPSNTIFSGVYTSQPADQAIQTTFAGGNATPAEFVVQAGQSLSVGPIEVPATGSTLNLRSLGFLATRSPSITTTAINLNQGRTGYLTVHGPGVSLVPDNGLSVSGSGVAISSSNILRGVSQGDPYMVAFLSVASNAKPGARTIFANDGTRIAALTGGIEIHLLDPNPSLMRNDDLSSAGSVGAVTPLDPFGSDGYPGTGEGTLRAQNGSADDDDMYAPQIESGFIDPDPTVLPDAARPLVLYQLDGPTATLYLGKSPYGRIQVTYTLGP